MAANTGPWRTTLEDKFEPQRPAINKKKIHLLPLPPRPSASSSPQPRPSPSTQSHAPSVPAPAPPPARAPLSSAPPDKFRGFEPFVDEVVVASFVGLTPRRVLELARKGVITSYPIGGRRMTWRFRISEVVADMERLKKPARATMPAAVPGTKERNRLG